MMTIQNIQHTVDQWINKYGVRYFDELTNMLLLTEEVGELSRLIAREYGEQSFKKPEDASDIKLKIADEMADVFFVLTCLANQMDINLEDAIRKNIDKKTTRDHSRHKMNKKINPDR